MIDLLRTRADLLREIDAPAAPTDPLAEPTDPRLLLPEARLVVCARSRNDLFPLLELMLSERFGSVPRDELMRDLLVPLRHAMGNAVKHGNRRDRTKSVTVEIVLTLKGALIAVTDEGEGFDVAGTLSRFRTDGQYFTFGGTGFRALDRATSLVSFEECGRSQLLCFRPRTAGAEDDSILGAFGRRSGAVVPARGADSMPAGAGRARPSADVRSRSADWQAAFRKVTDPRWVQSRLPECSLDVGKGRVRVMSCRVFARDGFDGESPTIRYVLAFAGPESPSDSTRILTGRLHPEEQTATDDFTAAALLYEQFTQDLSSSPEEAQGSLGESGDLRPSKQLRIPRPAARPADEPRLTLYDFAPWMTLREYFAHRGDLKVIVRYSRRTGAALARLHGSRIPLPQAGSGNAGRPLQQISGLMDGSLDDLPSTLRDRFRALTTRAEERIGRFNLARVTPVHGALGLNSIQYGADRRFYLFRFEGCRLSNPVADLGSFLADLLAFTVARRDVEAFREGSDAFLHGYEREAARATPDR